MLNHPQGQSRLSLKNKKRVDKTHNLCYNKIKVREARQKVEASPQVGRVRILDDKVPPPHGAERCGI